ncbi:MAG: tRNA (guanosine(37)-N1)-methyltransferase TrmD [Deltaproteobacteria bacterium]|nr:tRNA (guanosine(37)-N1)-methyltransferase TrmD [Deltaproteobacteria bacterium]
MKFSVLTILPGFFTSPFEQSIIGKAVEKGVIAVDVVNIRDFAEDKHKTTDDAPYGGGSGMVMKPEPLIRAIRAARAANPGAKAVLTSARGKKLDSRAARELAAQNGLVIIAGRYEGVDERVSSYVDTELSVGDYVLTGGEAAALVIIEAVSRFVPGVLGNGESAESESFEQGLLEHPHYTRPEEFEGAKVPEALISGNHKEIGKWRRRESLRATFERRPELLKDAALGKEDIEFLKTLGYVG